MKKTNERLWREMSVPHENPTVPPYSNPSLTAQIASLINSGHLKKAVILLFSSSTSFPVDIYAELFRLCSAKRTLVEARKLESHLLTSRPSPPIFLLNRALETFAKCGSIRDARKLFDEMPCRDGGTWNAMITVYAQAGRFETTLRLFSSMRASEVLPTEITFAIVLGSRKFSCGHLWEMLDRDVVNHYCRLNLDIPTELIPRIGMEFASLDEAYNFYNGYA
ncbi:hypothetical protein ACLOJK_038330 [Asimina triloba]